jgi:hypothetical protein
MGGSDRACFVVCYSLSAKFFFTIFFKHIELSSLVAMCAQPLTGPRRTFCLQTSRSEVSYIVRQALLAETDSDASPGGTGAGPTTGQATGGDASSTVAVAGPGGKWTEHPRGYGATWNLLWTWSRPRVDWGSLLPWQRVNHFPRSRELSRKDLLYANLRRLTRLPGKRGEAFEIMPTTFLLPHEFVMDQERALLFFL